MGNTIYPTVNGDFESRVDIVEYRIGIDENIIWKGTTRDDFQRQIEPSIAKYIKECDFEFTHGNQPKLILTRYYGSLIPKGERWHVSQLTHNFDLYTISFQLCEQRSDTGTRVIGNIIASHEQKDAYAITKQCFDEKHFTLKHLGDATAKFLKKKVF